MFVAGGNDNAGIHCIMTSPDGITWTIQSTPIDTPGGDVSVIDGFADVNGTVLAGTIDGRPIADDVIALMSSIDGGVTWNVESDQFEGSGGAGQAGKLPSLDLVVFCGTNPSATITLKTAPGLGPGEPRQAPARCMSRMG